MTKIKTKTSSDMKDKLTQISDDLNHDIITEIEAKEQLLILCSVVKSSCNCYADQWDKRENNTVYCTGCGKDV